MSDTNHTTKFNPGWWGVCSWGFGMIVLAFKFGDSATPTICFAAALFGLSVGRVTWSKE